MKNLEAKSRGQVVLEAIEAWILSWVVFPDVPSNQGLTSALWALHTWFAPKWPATAYLHVTSQGPGCGKTTLQEVLAALSCNPRMRATMRELAVVRDIEAQGGAVTYFFDQVEALQARGKISDGQAILLTGYRKGGAHGISVGTEQVEFSTYCAKCFACIGDIAPDLQSRSIVVRLGYGVPKRVWTDAVMTRAGEAGGLLDQVSALKLVPGWVPPDWLHGRNREIYTPIWSLAVALGLDAAMLARVRQAIDDTIEYTKTAERVSYRDVTARGSDQASKDIEAEYAELALRTLAGLMPEPSKTASGDLSSVHAVEALKAAGGPWRVFRGQGLNEIMLAGLLARFGVGLGSKGGMWGIREGRGRAARLTRGYRRREIMAALMKLEGK